jgi:hypothetical protein
MRSMAVWAVGILAAAALHAAPSKAPLSVEEIASRNAAARGGVENWRNIQSMAWTGHIESDRLRSGQVPFTFEFVRPNKSRFEINGADNHAIRIFDGTGGWKIHPARNGGADTKPYTPEELRFAADAQVIDGLLIDHAAKGVTLALQGRGEVDGRKGYNVRATLRSGSARYVWIDAKTFLEIREDRLSRDPAGHTVVTSVHYQNYQPVQGLMIPLVIESRMADGKLGDRMVIERVALNPPIKNTQFAHPFMGGGPATVTIGPDAGASTAPQPRGAAPAQP